VSQSASQAAAFFREVAESATVWFVRDDRGSPVPETGNGKRAFPYWSSDARARRAADIWGAGLRPVSMPLDAWRDTALPDLAADDCLVGINWTGPRLVGWEFTVAETLNRLDHALGTGAYAGDAS
jgi:hypothetical protein